MFTVAERVALVLNGSVLEALGVEPPGQARKGGEGEAAEEATR